MAHNATGIGMLCLQESWGAAYLGGSGVGLGCPGDMMSSAECSIASAAAVALSALASPAEKRSPVGKMYINHQQICQ